jgi:Cu(I)/Ag(I) efflux system membrane protein CusA/SilA
VTSAFLRLDRLSDAAGTEVMQRIAAPMVCGMVTAPLLSMFVIPVVYYLIRRPRRQPGVQAQTIHSHVNRL